MAWDINAIVEVRIGYQVNGQQCMNVIHYRPFGDSSGRTPFEHSVILKDYILGEGDGGVFKEMRDFAADNAVFNFIAVQGVYPTRFRAAIEELDLPGLQVGQCQIQNVQGTVQKIGALANRHNQGSFHMGAIPDDQVVAGELTDNQYAKLVTIATALKRQLNPVVDPPVVYDPVILNKVPLPPPNEDKFIISGSSPVVDTDAKRSCRTMSRRTLGRGI